MTAALTVFDCDHLADEITHLSGQANAIDYRLLTLIAKFDKRGGWSGIGIRSCAHWLAWKCGLNLGAAREKVRVALATGKISYSIVRALTRVATMETEDYYLSLAEWGTASQLERLVSQHRRTQRLQAFTQEEVQYADRTLTCYLDADGMWNIKAKLTPEQGELIHKLLYGIADGYLPGEEDAETEQKTFLSPDIDAATCVTKWVGDPMNLHMAVSNLMLMEY